MRAEEAVTLLGPQPRLDQSGQITVAWLDPGGFAADLPAAADRLGYQLPPNATADRAAATADRAAAIDARLRDLAHRWRATDTITITLAWHRETP